MSMTAHEHGCMPAFPFETGPEWDKRLPKDRFFGLTKREALAASMTVTVTEALAIMEGQSDLATTPQNVAKVIAQMKFEVADAMLANIAAGEK